LKNIQHAPQDTTVPQQMGKSVELQFCFVSTKSKSHNIRDWLHPTLLPPTHLITNLTPQSTVLLEKITVSQQTSSLPHYRPTVSITASTTAHHWSLSWARSIRSTPSQPISVRSIVNNFKFLNICDPKTQNLIQNVIQYWFQISSEIN
jgi:hypothetical protein